jgi:NADPH-dependent 2,4-dienoyl-CoA reductase/sulfur reductase-like enzyme
MKFLIIGGDAAGMSAASRAKRNMPELDVTVLEMTRDVSYSACGMPYNIADPDREMEELVVRRAQVFRDKQGIDLRTGHRADKIDRGTRTVEGTTTDGAAFSLPFDSLLIATGASPAFPEIPGIDLPGVMALKSLEDGRRIKSFIGESVGKAVIIGMGYIALEMSEALRERKLSVSLVKPRAEFLPWMNREMASIVQAEVEAKGVDLHPGHKIEAIESANGSFIVQCSEGLELEADMVLAAVGVKPNSELAEDAGLQLGPGRSVSVDRSCRTSDPQIYSAGDCADAYHVVTGEKTWIPLALRANRAGWAVADNVTGGNVELPGVVGTAVFKVFDLQVARSGLSMKEAEKNGFEPAEVMIKARSRAHGHPGGSPFYVQMVGDKRSGRLLGAQLLGKEGAAHRVNAIAVALHQHMSVEAFSQCDLAYAPPFGPTWDPMLIAANQLLKAL